MREALRDGFRCLAAGRLDAASACCKRLLGAKPDLVEAHFLVGLIAIEMRQTGTAISAFGSVTKLEPEHGAAWANLARLFMLPGQAARADAALEKAAVHHDGNPMVLDLIGSVYSLLGDQAEASRWIEKAVHKAPDHVPFLVNQANNHVFLGAVDQAQAVLDRALDLQPGNPNAHWILANVRRARDRAHVDRLQELLREGHRNPRALAFLYYGLGKELEDLEQWEEAFDAFRRGAEARRSTIEFDEKAEVDMFRAFGQTFTPEWFAREGTAHDDPSPIFVVGQPRTGTTLVERIITSHSQVHSAGELRQFGTCVRRLSDYREPTRYSARLARRAAPGTWGEPGPAPPAALLAVLGFSGGGDVQAD
ncbi:MAG: sulfotransferase, partial [Gammaproteobacteria bacterium]|nr:sulfotransferase [Gammaproteobacteria bacterium]